MDHKPGRSVPVVVVSNAEIHMAVIFAVGADNLQDAVMHSRTVNHRAGTGRGHTAVVVIQSDGNRVHAAVRIDVAGRQRAVTAGFGDGGHGGCAVAPVDEGRVRIQSAFVRESAGYRNRMPLGRAAASRGTAAAPLVLWLLALVAAQRAHATPWEPIAKPLQLPAETCAQWPSKYACHWQLLFQAAWVRVLEVSAKEAALLNWKNGR